PTVVESAGFTDVTVVPELEQPDPDFPTVAFPNPEEPGAIDLALALAVKIDADLVVANDPDADRCALAVPDPSGPDGWRMLRGDEVGALLADHLLRAGRRGVYARSIVSSSLLGVMAAAHQQPAVETLTGFKWIGRLPGLAFGYEEALGYCVDPDNVADKDGVSAGLLLCEIAAEAKAAGRSLLDLLDAMASAYGLHATDQLSARVDDLADIAAVMTRLRATPPLSLGGAEVTTIEDLSTGSADLPPTDGLRYRTADGSRVVVRPSGTEPKIKCYLEVVVPVGDSATGAVTAARREAATRLVALRADVAAATGL
ncbi:MAG: phospho-sugar mutase, partial [Nocardioidaceae bacterium]|nr:phospho-sugar mutase [Nocardioidaceae bacterium]